MIPKDIALLDKTDITVRTPWGEATLVIGRTDTGYACGVWSGDKLLGSQKFGSRATILEKATVIGPLLVLAKNHVQAHAEKHPDGVQIHVRVEHKGQVHEADGRVPMDVSQIAQFTKLVDFVRTANAKMKDRG